MPRKQIDIREMALIKDNIDLDPGDLVQLIMAETGIIVSVATISKYVRLLRARAEAASDLSLSLIESNVNEFVKDKTNTYLLMLDKNINDINDKLKNAERSCIDREGNYSLELYLKTSEVLGRQIHTMLKIAPIDLSSTQPKAAIPQVTIDMNTIFDAVEKERSKIALQHTITTNDYQLIDDTTKAK